jgi:nicotinamidase-related amidase
MPVDLRPLVAPAHTAVLTMEVQRGVVGDMSSIPHLRDAGNSRNAFQNLGRLCAEARTAGVRVVHCTAEFRADRAGSKANCRMLAGATPGATYMTVGSPETELIPELGYDAERDILVPRVHGMTPFTSTSLDQIIRNLGVTTVVATGVSVNIGLIGMVLGAVDRGYEVVVPTDAVAGVPLDYADDMLQHTYKPLATLTTTDAIIAAWRS